VYSPRHAADAAELGELLCKDGFPEVSVIQAAHITSMRVRVDFEVVADITYCPPRVFSTMPYLKYDSLRIIHPHFQMIDQHASMSAPWTMSGAQPVVVHRWIKDMTRYDRLYAKYPIVATPAPQPPADVGETLQIIEPVSKYRVVGGRTMSLPARFLEGGILCGWGAIEPAETKGDAFVLDVPDGERISIASDDYKSYISTHGLTIVGYYAEYFGKLPRYVVCTHPDLPAPIEVFDTYGTKISVSPDPRICNIQFVMLYLLVKIFTAAPGSAARAEEQYLRCRELVMGGAVPSTTTYGRWSFTHSFLNGRRVAYDAIHGIKPPPGAPPQQPKNVYPRRSKNNCKIAPSTFDPEKSEYFMTDGRELPQFEDWVLRPARDPDESPPAAPSRNRRRARAPELERPAIPPR
jgi:hypothetical protein